MFKTECSKCRQPKSCGIISRSNPSCCRVRGMCRHPSTHTTRRSGKPIFPSRSMPRASVLINLCSLYGLERFRWCRIENLRVPESLQLLKFRDARVCIEEFASESLQQDNFSVIEPIRQRGELRGQLVLAKWTPSLWSEEIGRWEWSWARECHSEAADCCKRREDPNLTLLGTSAPLRTFWTER